MTGKPSFLDELRRRNVLRAATFYAASAWLLVQIVTQVGPVFNLPSATQRWIVVAAAIGFPFAMALSWFYEWTPQGIQRESDVAPEDSVARETGRKLERWTITVLGLAVVLLLAGVFVLQGDGRTAAPGKSIAVLPLADESPNRDERYFSDGLSENLITALSQFDGLKVIGRDSAFQFRDSKDDSRTIGSKLGVATLLEGSVQRSGDEVRINAQLIRVDDGSTLWSQRYDRPYKDLFKLQDEITQAVAGELRAKLLANGKTPMRTDRPPGGSLDAYTAYQQGNALVELNTEANLRNAISHYATATRIDPRYALAWAAASHAGIMLSGEFLGGEDGVKVNAGAREAAATALALDPDLATAHDGHGDLLINVDFDWNASEVEYRRALELAPHDEQALIGLGNALGSKGQPEEGLALVRRGLETDPLNVFGNICLTRYLAALGRLDEASALTRRKIALQPGAKLYRANLAMLELQRGDVAAAQAAANEEPEGFWRDLAKTWILQVGSDRAAADAALKDVIDRYAQQASFQIAEAYALRHDPDKTFEWLDHAWTTRDPGIQFLLTTPVILRYRNDPRFAAFCHKVGLPTTTQSVAMP